VTGVQTCALPILARDLDVVLVDARDPWGGRAMLPAGRLREPLRALQRAGCVVVTRLGPGEDPGPLLREVAALAPAATLAAARHRVTGVRSLDGGAPARPGERVRVVTATGNPDAVRASAEEAGLVVVGGTRYRDHHWFSPADVARERARAQADGVRLLLTAKDEVRWPARGTVGVGVLVLDVAWEWVSGGDAVERRALGAEG
jgi:tetraacyldisaccharide 4'-kinase